MPSEFRALDFLFDSYPPLLRGRSPFWHPDPPAIYRQCRVPAWNWDRPGMDAVTERTVLDANGAFLAPLSGTELAHSSLVHTGADVSPYKPLPGYYRITAHPFSDPRLFSPLGLAPIPPTPRHRVPLVWVAAPTVDLLHKISEAGQWPGVEIHDSWTGKNGDRCRLKDWAALIRDQRADALHASDAERYEAVKQGYSVAVQMMLGPTEGNASKSKILRPDWYHAIRAQHAANMWRKAWSLVSEEGIPVLGMGNVDEIEIATADLPAFLEYADRPKAKVRFDPTGLQLGAFKVKP